MQDRHNADYYILTTKQSFTRTYFIIGIIIGLLLAIVYNYRAQKKYSIQQSKKEEIISKRNDNKTKTTIKKLKPKHKKKKKSNNNAILKTDTLVGDTITKKDTISNDSIVLIQIPDSVIHDSININDSVLFPENDSLEFEILQIEETKNSDITIAQDELIFAILAFPSGQKDLFACTTKNDYDSVLVNNVSHRVKDGLYIEFWRSPLNYTGYRLNTNSLVLFGFYEYTTIKLRYTKDGFLELKYKNNTFMLNCTDDFKPLHLK